MTRQVVFVFSALMIFSFLFFKITITSVLTKVKGALAECSSIGRGSRTMCNPRRQLYISQTVHHRRSITPNAAHLFRCLITLMQVFFPL